MANELIIKGSVVTPAITVGDVPITASTGTTGQVLTINSSGEAEFANLPGGGTGTTFTMVADHTALLAQTPADGQITFVTDDNGLNEYALYIYVNSTVGWKLISNQDSSAVDADTLGPITFTFNSPVETMINTVTPQTRFFSIVVNITTAFNGTAPVVTVGDAVDNSRLLTNSDVDLTTVGSYEVIPTYVYSTAEEVNLYLDADGSTQGEFNIVLSYN